MKVLVLGGEGMLGHKVFQTLSERFQTFATFRDSEGLWAQYPIYANADPVQTLGGVDALQLDTVARAVAQVRPDVVINCIGVVKQLKQASDPLIAIKLNGLFPHQLAEVCEAAGARLFQMSTDCVFSGSKGAYKEEDSPDPGDLYGRTKLLGELRHDGCLTIRTSIFGRDFEKQTGLLEWFLSNRGGRVRGFVNAIYTGFPTQVLARIMGDMMARYPHLTGLYHVASDPISKHDLLVKIRDEMHLNIEIERDESVKCDRSLDSSRFRSETGYQIPTWAEMVAELARDETPYDEWRRQNAAARR